MNEYSSLHPTTPSRPRIAAVAVLTVLAALLAQFISAATMLSMALREAGAHFEEAAADLENLRFNAAARALEGAREAAEAARDAAHRPALVIGSHIPLVGRDVRGLEALSEVAELSALAGQDALAAAQSTGVPAEGLGALFSGLELDVTAVEGTRPHLVAVESSLEEAIDVLERSGRPFSGMVADGMVVARSRLLSLNDRIGTVRSILREIPGIVGHPQERTYFLALQGPNEARGTGGLIGLYGIVTADDGRLRLRKIGPIEELIAKLDQPVSGPSWFRRLYGPMAALEQWEQANVSPNFPAVAAVLLRMYEASTGERLDGVISMDPVALAHLIRSTGPLSAEGMGVPIGPDNAARVLLHDSYFAFAPDQRARDAYLVRLVDDFWHRLSDGSFDVDALVRGAVRSARGRHLAIFSRDGREQQALVELGLDGGFERYGPNIQLVFNNNAAANKVDYFLRRSIHTDVQLSESGGASVSTRVTLRNNAPKGPPSYFLGPGIKGDPAGMNRMLLGFVLPQGSEEVTFQVDGKSRRYFRGRDGGYPVVWDVVEVPAGGSRVVDVSYGISNAWEPLDGGGRFALTLVPQPSATPDGFTLTISAPVGLSFSQASTGIEIDSASIMSKRPLSSTRHVELELTRRGGR